MRPCNSCVRPNCFNEFAAVFAQFACNFTITRARQLYAVQSWRVGRGKGESCSALVCHCIKMTQSERVEAAPTGNVGHFTWPSKRRSARKLLIENKLHFNLL